MSYFDEIAPTWDEVRRALFTDEVRRKALDAGAVQRGKVAADVGAGTGFLSEGLLARGLRVIAVDGSAPMVEEMRRKFQRAPGFEARLGDAASLPLRDGEADYAFANMYLHHVEDPGRAIAEMARAVKPGGRVVVTDMDEHRFEALKQEHHDRWLGFPRPRVEQWSRAAGLAPVAVSGLGEECCATTAQGEEVTVSIFCAVGSKPRASRALPSR